MNNLQLKIKLKFLPPPTFQGGIPREKKKFHTKKKTIE
jgi:hypothetical protein